MFSGDFRGQPIDRELASDLIYGVSTRAAGGGGGYGGGNSYNGPSSGGGGGWGRGYGNNRSAPYSVGGGRGGGQQANFSVRPGDWKCPNLECGNINFARRNECNKCQAPKPAGGKPPFTHEKTPQIYCMVCHQDSHIPPDCPLRKQI